MGKVLSILNEKGGVGKTTVVVNLVGELARRGRRVLVIDNDPQGNCSSVILPNQRELEDRGEEVSTASGLYYGHLESVTKARENVWICAADEGLVKAQGEGKGALVFSKMVRAIADAGNVDFIVIDNTPLSSNLTHAGLLAADHWLIVAMPEPFSLQGIARIHNTIRRCRDMYPKLAGDVLGIVLNMYAMREIQHRKHRKLLRDRFPKLLFDTVLKRRAAYVDAHSARQPVVLHAPGSAAAHDFTLLTNEILERIGG
jgi:chromosome partitioning protein